ALAAQGGLLCWNEVLGMIKSRWKILIVLLASASTAIELAAKRSVLDIVISYFLFDPGSYWYRRLIWMYATASVSNNPFFGVGLNEWNRPIWMGASIDNFWLFHAVRYGLPAAFLMPLAFFSIFLPVSVKKGLDAKSAECRTAFLIALTGFFVVAW